MIKSQISNKKMEKGTSSLLEITYQKSSGIPFRWEYEIENTKICEFVECKEKRNKVNKSICGGIVETTYYFKGIKKGQTKIIFKYINIADNYLSQINEYRVIVDEELNINIISKEIKDCQNRIDKRRI